MTGRRDGERLTRRALTGRALTWGGAAVARGDGPSSARRVQPAPADDFVASVGLCVHLARAPYSGMFNDVLHRARDLGVRHFRDDLRPSDNLDLWRALFRDAGIRAHLLVSPATNTPAEMMAYVRALGPRIVSAVEGQNEGDSPWFRTQASATPSWHEAVTDYQRTIFQAVRAEYSPKVLPVVSPSVLDYQPADMQYLRAAAAYCDVVALHAYVQEQQEPETIDSYAALKWYINEIRDRFKPNAPVMITESGYVTGLAGVSQTAAAIYLPRLLLNAFDHAVVRSFIYELLDEGGQESDPEQNYGLLSVDGTPKPAYYALCVLLQALADPGTRFEPPPVSFKIGRMPSDLRIMAFAKRNGGRWLALWRAASVWDKVARRDLPLREVEIDIELDPPGSNVAARSVWPGSDWRPIGSDAVFTVAVSEVVTLVRVTA